MNEEQARELLADFKGTALIFRGARVTRVRFEVDGKEADLELVGEFATAPLLVLMAGDVESVDVPEGLTTVELG